MPRPPEDPRARELWLELAPAAPIPWWQEAVFIVVETGLVEYGEQSGGWSWKMVRRLAASIVVGGLVLTRVHGSLEERRGRQLGLTIETAPRPVLDFAGTWVPLIAWETYRRVRGLRIRRPTFAKSLARRVIQEVVRRRRWREVQAVIAQRARGTG